MERNKLNSRSTIAAGVLCLISVLIIGSCVGCGILSFCFCDDAGVDAFYDGLAPDGGQNELEVQIEDESIEQNIDVEVRDSTPELSVIDSMGGQGVLSALYYDRVI